ncbi:hypothetical protein ACLM5H_18315 [Fredinandcohnia humi]
MKFEMRIARMLAENIDSFITFVQTNYENRHKSYIENPDKLYQLKLLVEEYKFQLIADELLRINQFSWNEKYTNILVDRFRIGMNVIEEYVDRNYNDLFIFTARLHTLKSLCSSF